jgi:hypothetical protein
VAFLVPLAISTAANFLIGRSQTVKTEGTRLAIDNQTTSRYGEIIPHVWGSGRVPAKIVVSSGVREVKTTRSYRPSKKSGKVEETTYSYFVSLAAVVAHPKEKMLRIWVNNKLAYDVSRNNSSGYVDGDDGVEFEEEGRLGAPIRFYDGNPDQLPDPKLEQIVEGITGVEGSCPAFRGVSMVVFDELDVTLFGGRIPKIEVEVSDGGEQVASYEVFDHDGENVAATETELFQGVSQKRREIVKVANVGSVPYVMRIDYQTQETFNRTPLQDFDFASPTRTADNFTPFASDDDYILGTLDTGAGTALSLVDIDTGVEVARTTGIDTPFRAQPFTVEVSGQATERYWILTDTDTDLYILHRSPDDWASNPIADVFARQQQYTHIAVGPMVNSKRYVYLLSEDDDRSVMRIHEAAISSSGTVDSHIQVQEIEDDFPAPAEVVYSESDKCLLYWYEDSGVPHMRRFTPPNLQDQTSHGAYEDDEQPSDTQQAIYDKYYAGGKPFSVVSEHGAGWSFHYNANMPTGMRYGTIKSGEIQWISDKVLWSVRVYDGRVALTDLDLIDSDLEHEDDTDQFYDSRYGVIVTTTPNLGLTSIFTGRLDRSAISLDELVLDLCLKSGLTADQVDVTDLEEDIVYGYISSTESTAKAVIDNLMQAYNFMGREIDGKLVFSKKNSDPVRTIYEEDLINVSDDSDKGNERYSRTRTSERDLPMKVELTYYDLDRNFLEGNQSSKRPVFPVPAIYSRKSQNFNWPIVMIADDAKQQADRLLYTQSAEREQKKFAFLPKHMDLDPGDVIQVQMDDGTLFVERIESFDVGNAFNSEVETVALYPPTFVSSSKGAVGDGVPTQTLAEVVESYLFLMDIPLLSVVDEPVGSTYIPIYAAVGADRDGWNYAQVQRSLDSGETYASWMLQNVDVPWGRMETELAEPPHGVFVVDDVNEITIKFRTTDVTLSSITQTEFFTGTSNLLLVDDEIIQFRDATKLSDHEWKVSYLRRGFRGTEWAISQHNVRPTVVVLDQAAVEVMPIDYTDVAKTIPYRAVSKDQYQEQADIEAFTMKGNAIRPWAPSDLDATLDGSDIDVTWLRRERLYTEDWLMSSTGDEIPDSEPTEEYNVYVLDAAHTGPDAPTTYVRKTTVTSEEWTYSAADQATDGFDPNTDTLHLAVCKVSSRIGDGFPAVLNADLTA